MKGTGDRQGTTRERENPPKDGTRGVKKSDIDWRRSGRVWIGRFVCSITGVHTCDGSKKEQVVEQIQNSINFRLANQTVASA